MAWIFIIFSVCVVISSVATVENDSKPKDLFLSNSTTYDHAVITVLFNDEDPQRANSRQDPGQLHHVLPPFGPPWVIQPPPPHPHFPGDVHFGGQFGGHHFHSERPPIVVGPSPSVANPPPFAINPLPFRPPFSTQVESLKKKRDEDSGSEQNISSEESLSDSQSQHRPKKILPSGRFFRRPKINWKQRPRSPFHNHVQKPRHRRPFQKKPQNHRPLQKHPNFHRPVPVKPINHRPLPPPHQRFKKPIGPLPTRFESHEWVPNNIGNHFSSPHFTVHRPFGFGDIPDDFEIRPPSPSHGNSFPDYSFEDHSHQVQDNHSNKKPPSGQTIQLEDGDDDSLLVPRPVKLSNFHPVHFMHIPPNKKPFFAEQYNPIFDDEKKAKSNKISNDSTEFEESRHSTIVNQMSPSSAKKYPSERENYYRTYEAPETSSEYYKSSEETINQKYHHRKHDASEHSESRLVEILDRGVDVDDMFPSLLAKPIDPPVHPGIKPTSAFEVLKEELQRPRIATNDHGKGDYIIPGKAGEDYPDYPEIPITEFHCKDKLSGFYADLDTSCQVWHFCRPGGIQKTYLCPNGTIFNQKHFICDWWYNVKCNDAPYHFHLNSQLFSSHDDNQHDSSHRNVVQTRPRTIIHSTPRTIIVERDVQPIIRHSMAQNTVHSVTQNPPITIIREIIPQNVVQEHTIHHAVRDDANQHVVQQNFPQNTVQQNVPQNTVQQNIPQNTVQQNIPQSADQQILPAPQIGIHQSIPHNTFQPTVQQNQEQQLPSHTVVQQTLPESTVQQTAPTSTIFHNQPLPTIQHHVPVHVVEQQVSHNIHEPVPLHSIHRENIHHVVHNTPQTEVIFHEISRPTEISDDFVRNEFIPAQRFRPRRIMPNRDRLPNRQRFFNRQRPRMVQGRAVRRPGGQIRGPIRQRNRRPQRQRFNRFPRLRPRQDES